MYGPAMEKRPTGTKVQIGRVSAFSAQALVAGIALTAPLKVGDRIHIRGHVTDLELVVELMQVDNVEVNEAKPGDSADIKVPERVRKMDLVYKYI